MAEHLADEEVSIGDYVLSGGELAAAVVIDAVARLLPGVLGNESSAVFESFSGGGHAPGILDCPQYTRPAEFRGWKVPEVLLGGNHAEIREWRKRAARRRRPAAAGFVGPGRTSRVTAGACFTGRNGATRRFQRLESTRLHVFVR